MISTLSSAGPVEFRDREWPGQPGARDYPSPGPFVPYGPPLLALRPGPRQDGGLIVITFDEGSDPAARCGEASGFQP